MYHYHRMARLVVIIPDQTGTEKPETFKQGMRDNVDRHDCIQSISPSRLKPHLVESRKGEKEIVAG